MDLKRLKELIEPRLGYDKKITNIDTALSENQGYGSVMLKLKVTIINENGKEEPIYLVAKRLPESESARESFDIQVSFKKEVQFYEVILPVLKRFQMEEGVCDVCDHFPKFYGARYNLNGTNDIIDDDGIMILEDLTARGFGQTDPSIGYDLTTSESILRDIAYFHGTVIALKYKKTNIFEETIKPICIPFMFKKDQRYIIIFNALKKLIQSFPEHKHLAHNATNFLEREYPETREPFSTLIHCDLWVNNIMNKIHSDGEIENVFVDFQLFGHRSPAADVFFFLWTSVEEEVLKEKIDHLLNHYFQSLLKRLKEFDLDTSPFTDQKFEEELRISAEYEFGHTLIFVTFLKFLDKQKDNKNEEFELEPKDIPLALQNFIRFMVAECAKRKWLQ